MAKKHDALIKHISTLNGDIFNIHVTPKASAERIDIRCKEHGATEIRLYVTTVPEDGKANKAVINLLSKALAVSKSSIEIVRGETARTKTIKLL
jgi:uncharacterized protein (TIGR00251 family)|tara:strand:- start:229718 stop:229999 length:282 start_codon:yes stop_codon:yes gene_type:complete